MKTARCTYRLRMLEFVVLETLDALAIVAPIKGTPGCQRAVVMVRCEELEVREDDRIDVLRLVRHDAQKQG